MSSIEFSGSNGNVVIRWSYDGDYYLSIEAKVQGFRGHADGHVSEGCFRKFFKDIKSLNEKRQGVADLESELPGEFEVSVHSIDHVGHLAISGQLSFRSLQERGSRQSLNFTLEFEPSQIERAEKRLNGIAI